MARSPRDWLLVASSPTADSPTVEESAADLLDRADVIRLAAFLRIDPRVVAGWRRLDSADAVVDALGGTVAVAKLFGVEARVVSNWRKRGLPAAWFVALTEALAKRGLRAPPEVTGMRRSAANNK